MTSQFDSFTVLYITFASFNIYYFYSYEQSGVSMLAVPGQRMRPCRSGPACACPSAALALPCCRPAPGSGSTASAAGNSASSRIWALSVCTRRRDTRTVLPSPGTRHKPPAGRGEIAVCTGHREHLTHVSLLVGILGKKLVLLVNVLQ